MKNSVFYVVMFAMVFLLFSADLNAQRKKIFKEDRGYFHSLLNLSEEQESKISKLRIEHQKNMVDLRSELEKAKLDLRELQTSGNYSRSEYLSAADKINSIHTRISKARANHKMDVYELLSNEQKKLWNEKDRGFRKGRGYGDFRGPGYYGYRFRHRAR